MIESTKSFSERMPATALLRRKQLARRAQLGNTVKIRASDF
jgi:hypothetical protein